MPEPLKNLYNETFFHHLSNELTKAYSLFDQQSFIKSIFDNNWASKALKQRMRHITHTLHKQLPDNYRSSLEIVPKSIDVYL